MFKRTLIAASLAVTALASAQSMAAVVGGGATLPEKLYGTSVGTGIMTTPAPGFTPYIGVGSGSGKQAFFTNDSTKLNLAAGLTVDFAGSDSLVSSAELATYNSSATVGRASFGPLIQIPAAGTSITVPYQVHGRTSLNLSSGQLADIFAGKITNWNQLSFEGSDGPNLQIKVVYRTETSGTTEIFTTHLKAVRPTSIPAASNSFATSVGFNPMTSAPAGSTYIGVTGSGGVVNAVAANDGAIGYASPDFVDPHNAAVVARVNGFLPAEVNRQQTFDTVTPPTGAALADPRAWVPSFANPSTGYPIVGYTNLIFSQCYKDSADSLRIRYFINRHYSGLNDTVVTSHSFIPLSAAWQKAVHDTFWNTASTLRVGDPSACNGIGRPQ